MTRNEFHEQVECNADYRGWHNAHELADKLYDDFETRTCENCKYNNDEVCVNDESPMLADFVSSRLWCDCFERNHNE